MALNTTVKNAIATAKKLTSSLADDLTIEPWTGNSRTGAPSYGSAVTYAALIEFKQRIFKDRTTGRDVATKCKVTILQPITATVATGRHNPIDPRDKLTLPDGTVAPIKEVQGFVDPSTGFPYMFEVFLG